MEADVQSMLLPPKPKFKIGDRVWYATTREKSEKAPCPDCLGKGKWPIKSPIGEDFEIDCPRCTKGWSAYGDLTLNNYVGHAVPLTIGQVTASTRNLHRDSRVEYMCNETGVGSGSVYPEEHLFETESEAGAIANLMASERNAAREEEDWRKKIRQSQVRSIKAVETDRANERARDAEWALSDLKAKIIEMPEYHFRDELRDLSEAELRKVSLYLVDEDDKARQ